MLVSIFAICARLFTCMSSSTRACPSMQRYWHFCQYKEGVNGKSSETTPKLSWGQDGPQESPSLDFRSSSNQFWIIFTCFRNRFYRLVSLLSAPAVGRGSNRKQPTAYSKLNDGCDGNALHNTAQHKNEKC